MVETVQLLKPLLKSVSNGGFMFLGGGGLPFLFKFFLLRLMLLRPVLLPCVIKRV